MTPRLISRLTWMIAIAWLGFAPFADASIAYLTGPDPFSETSNDDAMNAAFGSGNWQKLLFSNVDVDDLFAQGAYSFIYIDGGDGTATNFMGFLDDHRSELEDWVAAGGSLLSNAATWDGWGADVINMGFGGTSIRAYGTARTTADAIDPLHPIIDGSTGTNWYKNYPDLFAHNHITGTGFTAILKDLDSNPILVEKAWGSGHVMLGGLAPVTGALPTDKAFNLRVNMLKYGAESADSGDPGVVPEATSLLIWGLLGLTFAVGGWKRRDRE